MTHQEIQELHSGDEVYWADPEEGATSRILTIRTIEVFEEIVVITEPNGSSLDCFASELL